uniref:Vacuolar protein sorting-associated protein 18 homolog n=1 Tax=Acrobeloides nanus TaxID=290746 RepID=A0A914ECY7_9BILA
MSAKIEDTKGIFVRHNVNFSPKGAITHLRIQNENMLLALRGQTTHLQHIRLQNAKATDVPLPLTTHDRVAELHLDYNGHHAIVSTVTGENFYFNMKSLSLKPLKRLKNHVITAVGWNLEYSKETETGFILLGTNKGFLIETNITSNGNMIYMKILSENLSEVPDLAVTDISLHLASEEESERWVVFICMPGRLYTLTGAVNASAASQTVWTNVVSEPQPVLQSLFIFTDKLRHHCLNENQRASPSSFVVFPTTSGEIPSRYGWLTVDGVTMGLVDSTKTNGYEMIVEEAHIKHKRVEGRFDYPLDIALTEYHILLLYTDRIVALSLLNQRLAFEDSLAKEISPIVGMTRDASSQFIWVYTESSFFKYRPNDETRHIWRIYLERKEYGKARKITSQLSDQGPHQLVIKREAEKFVFENNYVAAAELLAESTEPFESTVLKFLKQNSRESRNGLKRYLELKLNKMARSEDKLRRDILVTWLLELQLSELAELRRSSTRDSMNGESRQTTINESDVNKLREELYCFLNRSIVNEMIKENLEAVYRMITSHVDFETHLYLATKLKDYDTMVKIHLLQCHYKEALEVMASQAISALFYKYAPDLIEVVPMELVKTLIQNDTILRPALLLPAFYKCTANPKLVAAAFYYLRHVVESGHADRPTHNFIVQLYANHKPDLLIEYLNKCGKERKKIPYDFEQALALCIEKKRNKCTIFLYCLDKQFENAIRLALSMDDIELAKECASEHLNTRDPNDSDLFFEDDIDNNISDEAKKRVWLLIARYMINKNKDDVASCMKLLQESSGLLKIQDILPYFPEFTKIEHFKEPLCSCLKEHSSKIQEQQKELANSTDVANEIRAKMEQAKTKYMVVKTSDKCFRCKENLFNHPFYAFVCRHFFHKACLEQQLDIEFTAEERARLSSLHMEEKKLQKEIEINFNKDVSALKDVEEQLKKLLIEECPLCGLRAIESIDKPFFEKGAYEKELASW